MKVFFLFYYFTVPSVGKFAVGELVGITPKRNNNHNIMRPNPTSKYPFLVPPNLFSARAFLPNASTKQLEKQIRTPPIAATKIPIMICFNIILQRANQRITGLEPVRAELKSAMLHQLHHIRMDEVLSITKKTSWDVYIDIRTKIKHFFILFCFQ